MVSCRKSHRMNNVMLQKIRCIQSCSRKRFFPTVVAALLCMGTLCMNTFKTRLPPETDEFGDSLPVGMYTLKKMMVGLLRTHAVQEWGVVNIGARDGVGSMGNTDPTWPLFSELHMPGMAVEASAKFENVLRHNFAHLKQNVEVRIEEVTPENVVDILMKSPGTEVIKMDIDGWDCDVLSAMLTLSRNKEIDVQIIMTEYNVKYPPPVLMTLATRPRASYKHCLRGHLYGCSLQYLNDYVMVPNQFVLVQVDWQNALFVRQHIATMLQMPKLGIDLAAAYQKGYSNRMHRTRNMPWNHDVDHFLGFGQNQTQDLLQNITNFIQVYDHHKQDGNVLLGVKDSVPMKSISYKKGSSSQSSEEEC